MVVAVFPGRFQPLHKGTYRAIKRLERKHHTVIAVRSAAAMNTAHNPLSFSERRRLLQHCLPGREIFPIDDQERIQGLVEEVCDSISFETVVSGDRDIRAAFKEEGFRVEAPTVYRGDTYSGENVRQTAAMNDDRWKELVPACSVELLEQFNFATRMERLTDQS